MADNDNTPEVETQEAPVEQDTLTEDTTTEPVETATEAETLLEKKDGNDLIFGKYKSLDDAKQAYGNIQARATKAEQQLKELKKQMEGKTREEIKSLDYDKQLEYLLNKANELEDFKASLLAQAEEQQKEEVFANDTQEIRSFIGKHPLLAETGLDEEFQLIATHPSMQDYTLDSIYEVKIKPKLERLMGTKITTKQRKLTGSSAKPEPDRFKDVSGMSLSEYEKHKKDILASAGIR